MRYADRTRRASTIPSPINRTGVTVNRNSAPGVNPQLAEAVPRFVRRPAFLRLVHGTTSLGLLSAFTLGLRPGPTHREAHLNFPTLDGAAPQTAAVLATCVRDRSVRASRSWICATTVAPSPAAEATRLTER